MNSWVHSVVILVWLLVFCPQMYRQSDDASVPTKTYEEFEQFLNEQRSQHLVINFWATWCKPCIEEMPAFAEVRDELAGDELRFVFVSLDYHKHAEKVAQFSKQLNIRNETVILNEPDGNVWINKIDPNWSGALPATLFITKGGEQRDFQAGKMNHEDLRNQIYKLYNK